MEFKPLERKATIERKTLETFVKVEVNLDGAGHYTVSTPIGFLTHMIEQLSRHSLIDMNVEVEGDTHIDGHHTTEDVAIVLGQAVMEALGDKTGIHRYGWSMLPMDEACVSCALDLSGRTFFVWDVAIERGRVGSFDTDLAEVFFEGFARGAQCNLHLSLHRGRNAHHIIEVSFKALAKSLRHAVEKDPRAVGTLPSTKGTLT